MRDVYKGNASDIDAPGKTAWHFPVLCNVLGLKFTVHGFKTGQTIRENPVRSVCIDSVS